MANSQRFKSALDQRIADEQARAKAQVAQRDGQPSTASSGRPGQASRGSPAKAPQAGAKKPRARKPSEDTTRDTNGDGAANPDPAVFEAAFALDDVEELTPSSTPAPPEEKDPQGEDKSSADPEKAAEASSAETPAKEDGETKGEEKEKPNESGVADANSAIREEVSATELPSEVKVKLRKLEKLEKTYPGQTPERVLPDRRQCSY